MSARFRPAAFHGAHRKRPFFEGWYVKMVTADRRTRLAVIPGLMRGQHADESFVQVLDGARHRCAFHGFPITRFTASNRRFDVTVGGNHFDARGLQVNLPGLVGAITYATPIDPWPVRPWSPGAMGWYGLMPFMQCYHAVVSFGHALRGELVVDGVRVNFDGGRGYIEKDWGSGFPAGYVWIHSNHVHDVPDGSLMASVAIVPWLRNDFRGFVIGLRHHGRLYRWATYLGSTEESLQIGANQIQWQVRGGDGTLSIVARAGSSSLLRAPDRTAMHRRIEESLDAHVHLLHRDGSGQTLLDADADAVGLEIVGETTRLLAMNTR